MSLCDNCINYPCTDGMSVMLKLCPAFSPIPKPLTNADHIRSMTNEELAEFFASQSKIGESWWLNWLKQEV